ncbi:uncharacterized protein LOC128183172 [Crassostrea angulata]|uniref:uncharacterized protein LOC128183172 n=1 Tax=Magallana angulata TaxID=2784310 RepID=UPI0022B19186|nr:uncharacterized protein LOC128183172 [Crassostrea angulata]
MIATFTAVAVLLIIKGSEAGLYDLFTPESRLSGFIMEKISPIGMVMCVKECSKRRFCASLNFSRKRLECELSHSDVSTNPSNMVSDPDFIYIGMNQIPDEYFDSKTASCPAKGRSVNTATGSKCVKSDCPSDHPDTNVTTVKVTTTKVGTVLNYTCNSDTSITLTSTCRGNGTWSSSAFLCPDIPDCFKTPASCWIQYNFTYDNTWDGCTGGTRYVRRTQYPSAPYVGVVLCSPTRYKIVLGSAFTDKFLSIGDGYGSGADHCELVGGYQTEAIVANDYTTAPTVTGYKRSNWGEPFTVGTIGSSTPYKYNSWYECGVTPPEPPCFNTPTSCWYEYSFHYDTAWNGCTGGRKYVMKTKYTSAPIVGVELCNSTRYQIFLGGNLTDKFLNIGDANGNGEDHCELVGGQEMDAVLPETNSSAPELTGYARRYVGDEFSIQSIGRNTGYQSNPWYECGVQIPCPHEPACMSATPPCWYALNVSVDNTPSPCTGGQILVKRTNYKSAPYLAVQLCNSTRYKLFLGSSLGATFKSIRDSSGWGEDHCELVGGTQANAEARENHVSPNIRGYWRSYVGNSFEYGWIHEYTYYLECGVSIPGTNTVV